MFANIEIKNNLLSRFQKLREDTLDLTKNLDPEDMVIQTNEYVSPVKWHLAHTTWFFENFILKYKKNYKIFNKSFNYLFNSYYKKVGEYNPKNHRGFISRPYVHKILKYRKYVEDNIYDFFLNNEIDEKKIFLMELGINHEQQHQELMIMDILNIFFHNPIYPNYLKKKKKIKNKKFPKDTWQQVSKTKMYYGAANNYFAYDNEYPRGEIELKPFEIDKGFVTNEDWREFINCDGYNRPELWLSDGWEFIKNLNITKPLYWIDNNNQFSLFGIEKIKSNQPVSNISFYEAYAFCKFKNKRLPSEFEIELYLQNHKKDGNFLENRNFEAMSFGSKEFDENAFGNLWLWTSSNYSEFPGYKPFDEKLGEYNQKFMCNQFVLKGGSFSTPKEHIRSSYRNFYYPSDRWQFSGLRLANNLI